MMKKIITLMLSAAMVAVLASCDGAPSVQRDPWQDLYDYLVEYGPKEQLPGGDDIRTFRLETKGENAILVGIYIDHNFTFSAGGEASFTMEIPHDLEIEECPVNFSAVYQYYAFRATESGAGTINRTSYESDSAFTWDSHNVTEGIGDGGFTEETSAATIAELVKFLDASLEECDLGITMADLGFLAYESPADSEG